MPRLGRARRGPPWTWLTFFGGERGRSAQAGARRLLRAPVPGAAAAAAAATPPHLGRPPGSGGRRRTALGRAAAQRCCHQLREPRRSARGCRRASSAPAPPPPPPPPARRPGARSPPAERGPAAAPRLELQCPARPSESTPSTWASGGREAGPCPAQPTARTLGCPHPRRLRVPAYI